MRGEVLHYDEAQGFGFITGADGNRYTFAREDLRRGAVVAKGASVEFLAASGKARDIFAIGAQAAAAAQAASAAPPKPTAASATPKPQHFGRLAEDGAVPDEGLWGYFWRGVTRNYINFAERARRKEFWGYCLYWSVSFLVIFGIGLFTDMDMGGFDADVSGMITVGLCGTFLLATVVPWLGLVVRRLHDLGLNGWLAIPCLVVICIFPLAVLILGLVPSQGHENQWGPVPAGVGA